MTKAKLKLKKREKRKFWKQVKSQSLTVQASKVLSLSEHELPQDLGNCQEFDRRHSKAASFSAVHDHSAATPAAAKSYFSSSYIL